MKHLGRLFFVFIIGLVVSRNLWAALITVLIIAIFMWIFHSTARALSRN